MCSCKPYILVRPPTESESHPTLDLTETLHYLLIHINRVYYFRLVEHQKHSSFDPKMSAFYDLCHFYG